MIRSLINLEIALLLRSKVAWSLALFAALVTSAALLIGEADRAQKTESQATFLAAAAEREAAFRDALLQIERGDDVSPFLGRPMAIRDAAVLPDGPLGDFSIGAGDLYPDRVEVRLWETSASLFENYQFENPTTLGLGRLDMTTVIVVIMPLLMIALSFDALGTDRQSGRLRLLLTSGASEQAVIWVRLILRFALLWLPVAVITTGAAALQATPPDAAARMTAYGLWLLGALAYGLFWLLILAAAVAARRSAGQAAASLVAVWAVFVLIIPALAAAIVQTVHPSPSRLAYLTEVRAVASKADEKAEGWLEAYAIDNPALAVEENADAAPFRNGYLRTMMVEEATRPLVAEFEEVQRKRQSALQWTHVLSPALAADSYLTRIAGGNAERYLQFQFQARTHLRLMADRLGPAILAGERISLDEYDNEFPRLKNRLNDHARPDRQRLDDVR